MNKAEFLAAVTANDLHAIIMRAGFQTGAVSRDRLMACEEIREQLARHIEDHFSPLGPAWRDHE